MDSNSSQSVIIGLDFGTTYSGIAWALKGSENLVEVVSTWPDGGNRTSPKVPTTISYENKTFSWGFQTAHSEEVIRGIKLLLDPDQETNYQPSLEAKKLLKSLHKTPGDVTAEYLEALVGHVKHILKRRFGLAANHMNLEFVLTVPAVWSDKAKDVTLKAAHSAGIPPSKLTMLSEPESAALYALRTIQPNTIKNDDVIVVCDAGGGTVDLISYAVESLSPLSLKEVVEGTGESFTSPATSHAKVIIQGGVCGSMILDERFEKFLEKLMGHYRFKKLPKRAKDAARRYWEEMVKPSFVGKSEDDFDSFERAVPLPGAKNDSQIGLEAGFLLLNESQIQDIFEPVVQDVLDLVRGQIKNIQAAYLSVKAIVLVGGFGGSEYLYRRLCQENPKITVMQPPNAWQAVVHGAVLRGLDGNLINSRQARGHYGVICSQTYNPAIHDRADLFFCRFEEKWKADNQLSWFIEKGSAISENDPIRHSFYRTWSCDHSGSIVFQNYLYFSTCGIAPQRKSKSNKDVTRLCTLDVDLSSIPRKLFTKKTNSKGASYYDIYFDLVLIPTSAYMYFQLEFNGISYGSVQAQY